MKDYRKLVPRTAPEGLLDFALSEGELEIGGMVYQQEWVMDESVEAILSSPGRKVKMVRCTCSECGQSVLMDYAPPAYSYNGGKPCYGFFTTECQGVSRVGEGGVTHCPVCGTPVKVRCASRIGKGEFCSDEYNVMSVLLLAGEPGKKPLVLTAWNIRRMISRIGRRRYDIRPVEAYIFEEKTAYKLNGWKKAYSGTAGYFMSVSQNWRQPVDWHETWGQCESIFGLTRDLVEDSCLHNSKFDLYMEKDWRKNMKSPVPYLRLYQIYPQIENLVVHGCTHLLDSLFTEKMRVSDWQENHRGLMALPEINFQEKRPAQMLWLTKEEFACMKEQGWDAYQWEIFTRAKRAGDMLKLPEDIEAVNQYGGEDLDCLIGRAPLGKCVRYLLKQIYMDAVMNDLYNEYADVYVDDEFLQAKTLADYWDMAELANWDLSNPAIRWPRDLIAAHEKVTVASKEAKMAGLKPQFKKRKKELEKFAYVSGGLMIQPAASQKQLNMEAKALSHCVWQYGEDHALGKTAVFFIRHTWAPRTPYFTLEFDTEKEKVRQNRGKCNCARTPEVAAFEKEWLTWVHKGCPREKDGTPRGAKLVIKKKPVTEKKKEAEVA